MRLSARATRSSNAPWIFSKRSSTLPFTPSKRSLTGASLPLAAAPAVAPPLHAQFLPADDLQLRAEAPELAFVGRVENPQVFADVDAERALKVLVFRAPSGAYERS